MHMGMDHKATSGCAHALHVFMGTYTAKICGGVTTETRVLVVGGGC